MAWSKPAPCHRANFCSSKGAHCSKTGRTTGNEQRHMESGSTAKTLCSTDALTRAQAGACQVLPQTASSPRCGGHIDVSVCDETTCNKTYIRPANNLLQLSQAHTLTSVAENRRMCASTASGRTCLQETKDCDHLVQNPKHTHTPANCTPTNCFDPINCFDQHNGRDTQDPNLTACKSAWGPGTPFPPAKTQPTNDLKLKSVSNSMRCL